MKPPSGLEYVYFFVYLRCILYTAYISNVIEIEHKVREILQFLLFGWGGRGGEATEWTRIYLFLCLIGKRAYISNLSKIEHKVREKLKFFLFGWGGKGR